MMDRFGLRVVVRGMSGSQAADQRLEVYRRVQAYLENPRSVVAKYAEETSLAQAEIQTARDFLPKVTVSDEIARISLNWVDRLQIDSLRSEITLLESARAYAAIDGRQEVTREDLRQVAPMALRMRRSKFMTEYFAHQDAEEDELRSILDEKNAKIQHVS